MSTNTNTDSSENLNGNEKKTIRMQISVSDAEEILSNFEAPFPPVSEIDEIHLIIN